MKNSKIILPIVLAAVISGGIFYYVGTKVGAGSASSKQGTFGQFSQNSGNRTRIGLPSGGGVISGSIINKDSQSITVQSRDGSSKIVFVSGSTQISKSESGSLSDLSAGQDVTVIGQTNSDGSVTAQSVQIRPTMPGQQQGGSTTTVQ